MSEHDCGCGRPVAEHGPGDPCDGPSDPLCPCGRSESQHTYGDSCPGPVGRVMAIPTRDGFERAWATRHKRDVHELRREGARGEPCRCGEYGCQGWKMTFPGDPGREAD